ncbi:biotin-dependent carboxyltransferase family protein [Agarivorans sp. Z349TD_8]|uniref:5-oxoprolinase subunit C family protein n=1 Tax=Agarivorans sp. Z349TD_8 TaxID=3421434 RepID=UPI003D7D6A78
MSPVGQLSVLRSGPQTSVVDQGRTGYQDIGISPGGAADLHAFLWANRLLGNAPGAAALEIAIGGATFQFNQTCQVAVCGADMPLKVSGASRNPQPAPWQSFTVLAGQSLNLGTARSGLRSYLAIKGGLQVKKQLGSASSSMRQGLGPFMGRWLSQGDQLNYLSSAIEPRKQTPNRFIPDYNQALCLNLIPGYQFHQFSRHAIQTLCHQTYRVSALSDRMGIRLDGVSLDSVPASGESEPIALGAVQVPPSGHPIVLSIDKQTIGGYPKLGCISRLSLYALNQRRAKQTLKFQLSSWQQQRQYWLQFQHFFNNEQLKV